MGERPVAGLMELGVSAMRSSSTGDPTSGATMWSAKWALNTVDTGRRLSDGKSDVEGGALRGASPSWSGLGTEVGVGNVRFPVGSVRDGRDDVWI
jgi:hypothetical protein